MKTSYSMHVALVCLTSALLGSGVSQTAGQVQEIDKASCESQGGKQVCTTRGVNGDGNIVDVTVNAPSDKSQFLGGSARALRQLKDNGFVSTCMMNPAQPPSVPNSEQRRCTGNSSDMSVERCDATSGSNPSLTCAYVNSTNAPAKLVELCGCWK